MKDVSLLFYIIAAISIISAVAVVTTRNMVRAVVYLALFFLSVAGLYITLEAEFLAVVQVFIYVGAVIILFLFLIMLTGKIGDTTQPQHNRQRILSLLACLLLLGLMIRELKKIPSLEMLSPPEMLSHGNLAEFKFTLNEFSHLLMKDYLFPFELISVLLLVALVGAIFLSREDKSQVLCKGRENEEEAKRG